MVVTPPKQEETITKISLSSVDVTVPEPVVEPIIEPEPEIIPEPIVERPTPIKKPPKPKKKPHHQKPPKPVEHQEVVENVPQVEPTTEPTPKMPKFSHAQVSNAKDRYLAKVHATVEKHKVYPRAAKRLNQTGKVHVNFDIMKNGKVKNVKIEKASKFEKLDEASVELLLAIAKFDEIPEELEKEIWNITIPIVYQIH